MSTGEVLLRLRKRAGLTQVQLSAASGVSQPHISEIETGNHRPGVDVAKMLARALNVDWPCFFADDSRNVDNAS